MANRDYGGIVYGLDDQIPRRPATRLQYVRVLTLMRPTGLVKTLVSLNTCKYLVSFALC